jgi:tetratricopeptide (TPR) repeat protein
MKVFDMALRSRTLLVVAALTLVFVAGCSKARKESVSFCNQGIMAYQAGEIKEALTYFEAAVSLYPNNQSAHLQIGMIMLYERKDYTVARRELMTALDLNPRNAETLYLLGRLELAEGNSDPALARFQEALKVQPDHAGSLYYFGVTQQKKGKLDEADEYFRKAITANPTYARAFNSLGLMYYETENFDEAIKVLKEGIRLNTDDPDLHQNLGLTYLTVGKVDAAVDELTASIELDPENPNATFNLANALIRQQRFKQASFYLRRFIVTPQLQNSDLLEPAKLTFATLQRAMAQGLGQ